MGKDRGERRERRANLEEISGFFKLTFFSKSSAQLLQGILI
jgi:hypothetical protein